MGGQVVSYVPDQLPRSRAYAAGPRRRTRPRVGGLLARSVLRYVTECKELIARIVGCSCDPGGRCCGGDLVDAVAGIANDPRGARRFFAPQPCIRLDPCEVRTMKQSFASAAGLRGSGPILTNGSMTMFRLGSPPPRIVSGQPGADRSPPGVPKLYACASCQRD